MGKVETLFFLENACIRTFLKHWKVFLVIESFHEFETSSLQFTFQNLLYDSFHQVSRLRVLILTYNNSKLRNFVEQVLGGYRKEKASIFKHIADRFNYEKNLFNVLRDVWIYSTFQKEKPVSILIARCVINEFRISWKQKLRIHWLYDNFHYEITAI